MFRTGSPYSPFFTSGLLSDPSSSRSPSPDVPQGPRRGSLPTDTPPAPDAKAADESSAFYFTLQPKRDHSEFRSFLSLDLAESQSMRSVSLKRKASGAARARLSTNTCTTIPEMPQGLAPPARSLRLRPSRDSVRTIPSPKPAPSITLPDVPRSSLPPRLPSIVIDSSLPYKFPAPPSTTPVPSRHSSLVIARVSLPPARPSRVSTLTTATAASSTSTCSVSTRVRKFNRSAALARLEGRSKSADDARSMPMQRNFINMDDDDEEEDGFVIPRRSHVQHIPMEQEDVVLPPASPIPVSTKFLHKHLSLARRASLKPFSTPRSAGGGNSARTTKEWFGFDSFIDLRTDDDMSSWNWRSFIEVASIS